MYKGTFRPVDKAIDFYLDVSYRAFVSKQCIPRQLSPFSLKRSILEDRPEASVGIGATSPIGLTCKYLPLAEAISSAPNTSRIACHLRIPTARTALMISLTSKWPYGTSRETLQIASAVLGMQKWHRCCQC